MPSILSLNKYQLIPVFLNDAIINPSLLQPPSFKIVKQNPLLCIRSSCVYEWMDGWLRNKLVFNFYFSLFFSYFYIIFIFGYNRQVSISLFCLLKCVFSGLAKYNTSQLFSLCYRCCFVNCASVNRIFFAFVCFFIFS